MKILPVGAEMFCAKGRTDGMTYEWTDIRRDRHVHDDSRFSQFYERTPKKKSM